MKGNIRDYIRDLFEDASIDELIKLFNCLLNVCDEISEMIIEKRKENDML